MNKYPYKELVQGNCYSFSDLIQWLVDAHFTRVEMVLESGDFSVRGSIIDIFSPNHTHPIRLEFLGDELERVATFDLHTQLSLSVLPSTQITPMSELWKASKGVLAPDRGDAHLLSSLKIGDFVVHYEHGIGIFNGLKHESFLGREGEYLEIKYLGNDRIMVPIDQIHFVCPYRGAPNPKLNSLNDQTWKKTTEKVKKATLELAEEVFILYKIRSQIKGVSFSTDSESWTTIGSNFPYQLTPDQARAVESVKADLEAPFPMDRLICGDVGFGKTEIAIRATYKVVTEGKQVVMIVPTTLLADQHFREFRNRLENLGVKVAVLSRLVNPKQQKGILSSLQKGHVDVLIGTHRVLSADVRFRDLGLLIVDEEQRFGVTHKEKIKHLKTNIDTLSMSATPIPRTLYMALTGARDLSQIKSPPQGRKPILTHVSAYSDQTICLAIEPELARSGQVYYVFNNIRRMNAKRLKLQRLLPNARILMAHGQMSPEELEMVMNRFFNREADILLSTTIIENGIDIANVNTIIIDQVHHLGLSQIHQLRGRVGRSDRQAYAWLLYPSEAALSAVARERISAIKTYTMLGAGYDIALKDLEIRGAGSLLGKKQHGYMSSVGFDLYCKILEESVRIVRAEPPATSEQIALKFPRHIKAMLPADYVGNTQQRLALYYRISECKAVQDVEQIRSELIDRFGPVPPSVLDLLHSIIAQIKK